MILILGGTTEGRIAVQVADSAGSPYFYSTRGEGQSIECHNGRHITGAMDAGAMASFCEENGIRLLVDAAHPFAALLHSTVAEVSDKLEIPAVRLERIYPSEGDLDGVVWCDDYADAITRLESAGVEKLLALTGVQTIAALKPWWDRHECIFRILNREESLKIAEDHGIDRSSLAFWDEDSDAGIIQKYHPQAILTKESGRTGGFMEKYEAARGAGIPLYVVRRPALPEGFITVTGKNGLRKAIERLVPGFFPLRSGFTTGACATAASKAALLALLGRPVGDTVEITFPDGESLALPVESYEISTGSASATVIKDAGDDPDVTNGRAIVATVAFSTGPGIHFLQGEGVGRVTLPGLGLPVGGPAINKVPREMINRELSSLCDKGLDVTISVPGGRELAQKTFNPKLGVVDGISIIGTSGIVMPFSSEAFVDAIRKEMEVAVAIGCSHIVINSGAKSEAFLKSRFPELPPQAFIHYGNYIGETLRIAAGMHIPEVTMGIMIGKAVKLAEGHLDTHSRSVVMNRDFLKSLASDAGCSDAALEIIGTMSLARELWKGLPEGDSRLFFDALLERCRRVCSRVFQSEGFAGKFEILLMDEEGNTILS